MSQRPEGTVALASVAKKYLGRYLRGPIADEPVPVDPAASHSSQQRVSAEGGLASTGLLHR